MLTIVVDGDGDIDDDDDDVGDVDVVDDDDDDASRFEIVGVTANLVFIASSAISGGRRRMREKTAV